MELETKEKLEKDLKQYKQINHWIGVILVISFTILVFGFVFSIILASELSLRIALGTCVLFVTTTLLHNEGEVKIKEVETNLKLIS